MKKYLLILIILVFCIGGGIIFFVVNDLSKDKNDTPNTNNLKEEIEIIEKKYMTDEGLIRTFPVTSNREFLAESQGFYLELLLIQKDEMRFQDQVNVLKNYFIVQNEDDLFIKWKTGVDISVNAFIDDMRIIQMLREAAIVFQQDDYLELANKLTDSIKKHQIVNNQISHYYDWEADHRGNTMINSYLKDDYIKILETDKYPLPTKDGLFYSEELIIENGNPVSSREAHMIDQLLTATYCRGKMCENIQFNSWLEKQWEEEGVIYGRYNKDTGMPTVKYESLAVYALSVLYFKESQPSIARDIRKHKSLLFNKEPEVETHFFDYILGVIAK